MDKTVEREFIGTGIPSHAIDDVWNEVSPWVAKELENSNGEFDIDDIYLSLINREMQLWVMYEKQEIVLAVVTQIMYFPQKKVCRIVGLGGQKHILLEDKMCILEEWASERECHSVEAYVSSGTARKLKKSGYNKTYTVVSKNIGDQMKELH